jgi:hypothetical protein
MQGESDESQDASVKGKADVTPPKRKRGGSSSGGGGLEEL